MAAAAGGGYGPVMTSGSEIIAQFLPSSPFVQQLGITLEHIGEGEGTLLMPFDAQRTTIGDVVHGGAIATLCDLGVMVAAWAGAPAPEQFRGVTISLSVEYIAAASAVDLRAHARLLRRGRSLCFCEVEVRTVDDPAVLIAKALGSYKLG